jgi:hypothetical protein
MCGVRMTLGRFWSEENPPHQHDDFPQSELGHGAGVTVGIIEHRDALLGATGAVNLLDADTVRAYDTQFRSSLKNRLGDSRLGPDTEHGNISDLLNECGLVRAAGHGLDFVAGARECRHCIFMNALKEQCLHRHLAP